MLSPQVFSQDTNTPAKPVILDTVKESAITPKTPMIGKVYSIKNSQFTSAIAGQLDFVAQPGTVLQEGDLIAKIDSNSLDLELQEQKALITRAEVQLEYLQSNLKRQKDLAKANSVSINFVEQLKSQKDLAANDLNVAKLRVKQIEYQIYKTEIRAEHNGIVTQRIRREGETISSGSIIGSFVDIENLEVRVQLPIRYTSFIETGDELEINTLNSKQKGWVKSIFPNMDIRSQSHELRVAITADTELKIGQLVSVFVPIEGQKKSLVVHQDALVLREEGSFVYRVNAENKVDKVMVETSTNLEHLITVTGDLQVGDLIVIRGAETLQNGNDVHIIKSTMQ